MRITCVSLVALSFCSVIAAQASPHPTTNPKAFSGIFTGNAYATYPLGRTGGLIQYWRRGSDLTMPQIITATGARATQTLVAPAFMLNGVELTMSNTPVTFQGFSSTYANNFGPQSTIVFSRKAVNLVALNGNNSPNVPVVWLTHDRPFIFQGPNFLVQFDLGTAVGSVGINRPADGIPSGGPVTHLRSAPSCGGTLTASGTGTSYDLALQGALPNSPGVLMLGKENVLLAGSPVLPFKLDLIGMTNCFLGIDPLITTAFMATPGGGMTWSIPINYVLGSNTDIVHAQIVHPVTSNSVGWGTTNVTHSKLGDTGMGDYAYNYTADTPIAQYGPFRSDRGGILLFQP